jgi:Icc-related predicted phosphoesterase
MKAWVFSDIHLTRLPGMTLSQPMAVPDADICICAGDTSGTLSTAVDYLLTDIAPCMPVVTVLGNHEYYGLSVSKALSRAKRNTNGSDVHVLENSVFMIDGLRVLGATLWTDLAIPVGDEAELPEDLRLEVTKLEIPKHIADYTEIYSDVGHMERITPDETVARHKDTLGFLIESLETPFDGKTVVLTHHAPLLTSIDQRFLGNISNAAYASDLSALIDRYQPDMWVHGHVHQFFDYRRGKTRVLCNPRGFSNESATSGFVPDLIVDL